MCRTQKDNLLNNHVRDKLKIPEMMHSSKPKAFLEFIYIFDLHIYRSSATLCLPTTEFHLVMTQCLIYFTDCIKPTQIIRKL